MSSDSNVIARLRLIGAATFSADARRAAHAVDDVGDAGKRATRGLGVFTRATDRSAYASDRQRRATRHAATDMRASARA